jgi:hypothetical protein
LISIGQNKIESMIHSILQAAPAKGNGDKGLLHKAETLLVGSW